MFRDFLTETEKNQADIRPEDDGLVAHYKWRWHQGMKNYGKDAFTSPSPARPRKSRRETARPVAEERTGPARLRDVLGGLVLIVALLYGMYALITWLSGGSPNRRPSTTTLETQAELIQRCDKEGHNQQYRGAQFARDAHDACLARGPAHWTYYH